MATKYFFPEWATVHVRVTVCVNILNFVFFHPQPWSPTFVLTDPLCVAPEPGFTHSSVNGRINNNNSPARIAFPGWVSLALAVGAAAARLRAPTEGLNTPPRSCMITNLLPSLFFFYFSGGLCSPKSGPGRSAQGSGARMMPFSQNAHGGSSSSVCWQPSGPVTPPVKELRNVLCATSVSCYHGNVVSRQQGGNDVAWGRGRLPEHTGGFSIAHDERRSRSTQTSRAERSPPSSIIKKINHDP